MGTSAGQNELSKKIHIRRGGPGTVYVTETFSVTLKLLCCFD
jgi:hypothetical protein